MRKKLVPFFRLAIVKSLFAISLINHAFAEPLVVLEYRNGNIDDVIDSENPSQAWMRFKTAIIPYIGNEAWVEEALVRAKRTLEKEDCPLHSEGCEHGKFIEQVRSELEALPLDDGDITCRHGPDPHKSE